MRGTLPGERCWHRMHGLSGTQHDNIICYLLQPNWRPKIGVVFPGHEPFCSVLKHDRKVSYLQHWSPYSSCSSLLVRIGKQQPIKWKVSGQLVAPHHQRKPTKKTCRFHVVSVHWKKNDLKNISQSAIQVTSACSPTWWQEIYEHQHHSGPLFPFSWTYDWGIGIACW